MITKSVRLYILILWMIVTGAFGEVKPNQGKGLFVKVQDVLGVPTFVISNDPARGYEPFFTPCFETYAPRPPYFQQFADAGTKLYSFNTNAAACDYGHSLPHWTGPDQWDYHGLDERIQLVLDADPDAMIMPRINLGTPSWWVEAHPDEWEILDHGSAFYKSPNRNPTVPKDRAFPSIVSEKWRQDIGMALQKLIEHIESSDYADHIFGYFLAGLDTEEWYHWSSGSNQLSGYSTHMEKAFRQWVKDKYVDVRTLRRVWNRPGITFEDVKVPGREERFDPGKGTFRDPAEKMNVIDFYCFYNEIVPDTIDYFAKITKQATGGTKAVGAFYGYMYEFRGDPEYGHNALEQYNESPYLDFIFVTASYGNRFFGKGGDYSRAPAYSVQLHDKLWYHDNDVVSFLARKMWEGREMNRGNLNDVRTWMTSLGYTETAEQSIWMYRRAMGFALCSGAYESFFDLHGGYYDHPDLMAEVARLNRLAEVAVRYERTSNSEILVVSDERSCAYATFRSDLLGDTMNPTQYSLIKIGAPADHVLINDLDILDTSQYKLVIFLNTYNMTSEQRQLVQKKLMNNGRHLLWCYAPGYFNETRRSPRLMQALTGLKIMPSEDGQFIQPTTQIVSGSCPAADRIKAAGYPQFGGDRKCCELFYVDSSDPKVKVMGTFPGSGKAVFAAKDMGDWKSIYLLHTKIPPTIYRELARSAGVHIFNEKDDTLYANDSFLCIHANGPGKRTIRLPWAADIVNMIGQVPMASNSDTLEYDFQNGETLILRWKTRL